MRLLDCGCGPGSITLGLAEVVSPGEVVGVDLEPRMIERARVLAGENGVSNVNFTVADITDLPFDDGQFDAVFSSSVLEHLVDPVKALSEMRRVLKPGGLTAIVKTDWVDPFIVPENESMSRFLELFEDGFNRYGGSLNRGRHLMTNMKEAGFEIVEFEARFGNSIDNESVKGVVDGYIGWMENVPLFSESIELGLTTAAELESIKVGMREWSQHPDVFFANARTQAIGRK
jgi:ubiquinone/menaquinone biosynthesis C-methylase UbiE